MLVLITHPPWPPSYLLLPDHSLFTFLFPEIIPPLPSFFTHLTPYAPSTYCIHL